MNDEAMRAFEHRFNALDSRLQIVAEGVDSLRRVMTDEFGSLRHLIQALDRDVEGLTRYITGRDEE
jgi:hypothetical protein